jgi:hypothetical protein
MTERNESGAAIGVLVLLVYAVIIGVLIGREFERRERQAQALRHRVVTLESLTAPQRLEAEQVRLNTERAWQQAMNGERGSDG